MRFTFTEPRRFHLKGKHNQKTHGGKAAHVPDVTDTIALTDKKTGYQMTAKVVDYMEYKGDDWLKLDTKISNKLWHLADDLTVVEKGPGIGATKTAPPITPKLNADGTLTHELGVLKIGDKLIHPTGKIMTIAYIGDYGDGPEIDFKGEPGNPVGGMIAKALKKSNGWAKAADDGVTPVESSYQKITYSTKLTPGKSTIKTPNGEGTFKKQTYDKDGQWVYVDVPGTKQKWYLAKDSQLLTEAVPPKPVTPPVQSTGPKPFPKSYAELTQVKALGGQSGAQLVKDSNGTLWVYKTGNTPGHVEAEHAANKIYEAHGILVPRSTLIKDQHGQTVQLTEFHSGGKELGQLTGAELDAARKELKKGFVLDAVLNNRDVVGPKNDNVLVLPDGRVMRIDNGGPFDFGGFGGAKPFGSKVDEIETLLTKNKNAGAAFAGITKAEMHTQALALQKNKAAILAATPDKYKQLVSDRIDDAVERTKPSGANSFKPGDVQTSTSKSVLSIDGDVVYDGKGKALSIGDTVMIGGETVTVVGAYKDEYGFHIAKVKFDEYETVYQTDYLTKVELPSPSTSTAKSTGNSYDPSKDDIGGWQIGHKFGNPNDPEWEVVDFTGLSQVKIKNKNTGYEVSYTPSQLAGAGFKPPTKTTGLGPSAPSKLINVGAVESATVGDTIKFSPKSENPVKITKVNDDGSFEYVDSSGKTGKATGVPYGVVVPAAPTGTGSSSTSSSTSGKSIQIGIAGGPSVQVGDVYTGPDGDTHTLKSINKDGTITVQQLTNSLGVPVSSKPETMMPSDSLTPQSIVSGPSYQAPTKISTSVVTPKTSTNSSVGDKIYVPGLGTGKVTKLEPGWVKIEGVGKKKWYTDTEILSAHGAYKTAGVKGVPGDKHFRSAVGTKSGKEMWSDTPWHHPDWTTTWTQYAKAITSEEKNALYAYTGNSAFEEINNWLRGKTDHISHTNKTRVASLDTALMKGKLLEDTVLWRGVSHNTANKMTVGDLFTDEGYASTSTDRGVAYNWKPVLVKIYAPGGTHGAYVSHYTSGSGSTLSAQGSGEKEFILPRNFRYRILSKDMSAAKPFIEMELVDE